MSRAMKNSGIPWIGEIPSHWDVCCIKHIMRNKSIKGYPQEQVLSLYREFGVVPKDSRDDNHNVTSEDTSGYKLVDVGDFVINKMKAWQGSMAVSSYRGIISPAYYICTFTSDKVDRKYIHYLLRNDSYKAEYMRLSTGLRIGQWDLNIDDFLNIQMVVPSITEQKTIADYLDEKCSEIDEMVVLQEKIIEELKAYKQSVITETVTKGLDPTVPMKDSGIEWIGNIPQHWEVCSLKRLCKAITDGSHFSPVTTAEGKHYITVGDVHDDNVFWEQSSFISEQDFEALKKNGCQPQQNSVLLAKDGTVGRTAIVKENDYVVLSSLGILTPKEDVYCYYLKRLLDADCLQEQMKLAMAGSALKRITLTKINKLMALYIPLKEQQQIADYLDEKCSEIDQLISLKQSKIDQLKEYKKSLIYECVTGKKEVV